MNKLLDAAYSYTERGWPVLKCRPKEKRPATPHGVKDATTNHETITRWFEQDIDANIGIATGKNLAVLDVDPRNGGLESIDNLICQHGKEWLNTLTVVTGGDGTHHYFTNKLNVKNYKPAPGIDLQSYGLYVLAPPSIHPSGKTYEWEDESLLIKNQLLELPEFLISTDKYDSDKALGPNNLEKIYKGERNNAVFKYACSLRSKNINYEEAKYLVLEFIKKCIPSLTQNEAIKCLNSAWKNNPTFNLTDVGNAQRIVNKFGRDLIYIPKFKKWMNWNENRWTFDVTHLIERIAKETVKSIYCEAKNSSNELHREQTAKWAKKSENATRIENMIKMTRSEPNITVVHEKLDSNPMLFGITNGTLELQSGVLRTNNREDYITKFTPVSFNNDAVCPTWIKFLNKIMDKNQELIQFIQKMVGYMLTGDTREQCIFIAYGKGANGKTTFANILKALLGDYCLTMSPETLMLKHYSGGATPELARLRGARLVLSAEPEEGSQLAESLVKQLTGQDTITARALYNEPFEFQPNFKILLSTNHQPIIGDDNAIWRRIRLIPFNVTIPNERQNKTLHEKLCAELPGILNWAIEGCLKWQRSGLNPPRCVVAATDEYRNDMDILASWIDECCILLNQNSLISPTQLLYASYYTFYNNSGIRPVSRNGFSRKLKDRGFKPDRTSNIRGFRGIGLRGENGNVINLDTVIVGGRAVGYGEIANDIEHKR